MLGRQSAIITTSSSAGEMTCRGIMATALDGPRKAPKIMVAGNIDLMISFWRVGYFSEVKVDQSSSDHNEERCETWVGISRAPNGTE